MSIPPVSSMNIAASIAGTERAAGAEVASSQNKSGGGGATATDSMIEQIEKVTKCDLSGDSDADGRQMLDTFERRHQDDSREPRDHDDDPSKLIDHPSQNPGVIVNRPTLGGHIDLCG